MKTIAMAMMVTGLSTGLALAEPVLGVWKTQPGDNGNYGHVTIKPCGEEICGVLGDGFDGNGKEVDNPNKGKRMVWGMKPKGEGTYAGGKIWAPDRDKTYNSKMALNGDRLEVKGCVFGICRGQTWTRVK